MERMEHLFVSTEVERRVYTEWPDSGIRILNALRKTHEAIEGPSGTTLFEMGLLSAPVVHSRLVRQEELPCRGYIAYSRVGLETWVLNPFRIECPYVRAGFVCTRTHLYAVDRPICGAAGMTTGFAREVTCEKCRRMEGDC